VIGKSEVTTIDRCVNFRSRLLDLEDDTGFMGVIRRRRFLLADRSGNAIKFPTSSIMNRKLPAGHFVLHKLRI